MYAFLCLQNPANKREIHCDDKLKAIFEGKEKVGFLEIGKLLSRHFVKAEWMLIQSLIDAFCFESMSLTPV